MLSMCCSLGGVIPKTNVKESDLMPQISSFDTTVNFCPLDEGDLVLWGGKKPLTEPVLGDGADGPFKSKIDSPEPQNGGSRAQLAAARQELRALRESCHDLKQTWLDEPYWRRLAKSRKYRMPAYYLPISRGGIEKVIRALGQDKSFFRTAFGFETFSEFVQRNPRIPLWAFAGLCLESLEQNRAKSEGAKPLLSPLKSF